MTIAVDSSVAVKWFVEEPLREEAARLLDGDEVLVAPDILMAEVANALWRKARRGELAANQISRAIAELDSIMIFRPLTADFAQDALLIANEVSHSIYDCLFLACAVRERITLITADAKFVAKVAGHRSAANVRLLQKH